MPHTRKKRNGGLITNPLQPNTNTPTTTNVSVQSTNDYIFFTNKISTQPNIDPAYKEVGIIHFTDTGAVNIVRQGFTGISNIFGKKGFDNTIYDKIRNEALMEFSKKIATNQKVANVRMELETDAMNTILIHIYGTLLQRA